MTRPNYEDSVAGELPQDKEYWEELAKRKYPSTYRYDGEDWTNFDAVPQRAGFLAAVEIFQEEMKQTEAFAHPPQGWYPFGTHIDEPGKLLKFWGAQYSKDGLPIWERPL